MAAPRPKGAPLSRQYQENKREQPVKTGIRPCRRVLARTFLELVLGVARNAQVYSNQGGVFSFASALQRPPENRAPSRSGTESRSPPCHQCCSLSAAPPRPSRFLRRLFHGIHSPLPAIFPPARFFRPGSPPEACPPRAPSPTGGPSFLGPPVRKQLHLRAPSRKKRPAREPLDPAPRLRSLR